MVLLVADPARNTKIEARSDVSRGPVSFLFCLLWQCLFVQLK